MKNTALVIMAAGIGSRFGGGIKQLEPVGPNGEIIMDYSIHDAMEAGFNKVIFIIRRDLEKDFKEIIGHRIEKLLPVEYAYQELEDLPAGYEVTPGRTKPWGTGQAVLSVKGMVDGPFLVINADDYYGREGFRRIHDYMAEHMDSQSEIYDICMGGFVLSNTLSDNGTVTRGVCHTMDGGEVGELEFENFNAAFAKISFKGRNVHPGYAKNKMINSIRVANRFMSMLPADEAPEHTEGYEGFYHLIGITGEVEQTT